MWRSYEELLDDLVLKFQPSKLVVFTLPPLEGSLAHHDDLVTKFNNCLKKRVDTWRQKAASTQIVVIEVYKKFEGKKLSSRDDIHLNKRG